MAIKKGEGHNGPSTLLVGAISQSFAGFTQWRTLAGTLTNKIKKVEVNGFEKSDGGQRSISFELATVINYYE